MFTVIQDIVAKGSWSLAARLQNIITLFVWNYTRRGLLDSDKLTVVSMMCMNILVRAGKITTEEKETLIRCPPDPNPPAMPENARSWLSETQWAQLKTLENMEAFKKGGQLTQNIEQDSLGWKRWVSEEKAENADLPRSARDLNQFQRLFLLRVMRQDRLSTDGMVSQSVYIVLHEVIGSSFIAVSV